jgi:hypothetical protein
MTIHFVLIKQGLLEAFVPEGIGFPVAIPLVTRRL